MGRVSLRGVIPLTYTRDHPGPIARDALDAALMLQVMAGPDPRDPRTLGLPPVPDYVRAATPVEAGRLRWPLTVGVIPDFLDEGEDPADLARSRARSAMLDTFRGQAPADSDTLCRILTSLKARWAYLRPTPFGNTCRPILRYL